MTEAEWLACDEPMTLLMFKKKASDRKHRLFQVACLRRIWQLMPNEDWREAVAVAERYADKLASDKARIGASYQLIDVPEPDAMSRDAVSSAQEATCKTMRRNRQHSIGTHGVFAYAAVPEDKIASRQKKFQAVLQREQEVEARIVRDIFGNPFRPIKFSPSWRTSTVLTLAQTMYDSRDFSAMPILADALQGAGCDKADILDHCRDATQLHVRGCWVVDACIGKG